MWPSLYHVITGGGNPVALQGNVTFCFSFTIMEGEGFVTKCGDSVNIVKQIVNNYWMRLSMIS